ncbi:unnamed protein product, partial [Pylaiella littoralis]
GTLPTLRGGVAAKAVKLKFRSGVAAKILVQKKQATLRGGGVQKLSGSNRGVVLLLSCRAVGQYSRSGVAAKLQGRSNSALWYICRDSEARGKRARVSREASWRDIFETYYVCVQPSILYVMLPFAVAPPSLPFPFLSFLFFFNFLFPLLSLISYPFLFLFFPSGCDGMFWSFLFVYFVFFFFPSLCLYF